ncbi:MAG TPA: hypothetical protein VG893_13495 [Terracidiphilus sp.]|nr:hypothetical protein [Terracidiphilus sp.]
MRAFFGGLALCCFAAHAAGQAPLGATEPAAARATPIAIVPLSSTTTVTGGLQVTADKAIIGVAGSVISGKAATEVTLPQRGTLRVCASTTVKLASDTNVPGNELPGLLMAFDHGALETSFSTGSNADTILTPDFRILIGGPGASHVKVRLADHGDTCVDNPRIGEEGAPYVLVTSVFDGSLYRVQPGQRVLFEHGSTHEVVDQEKEPCGCPPAQVEGNEFPLAQSAGLAPMQPAKPATEAATGKAATAAPPLVHNAAEPTQTATTPAASAAPASTASAAPAAKTASRKPGFFGRIGHFFKHLFGGD